VARLTLDRLTMRFRTRRGETITALEDVSFEVKDQEFAVLVGTSGCGKSTILRLVAGLIRPESGRLRVFGRAIERLTEEELLPLRLATVRGLARIAPASEAHPGGVLRGSPAEPSYVRA